MAACVCLLYPEIERVRAMLLYVVCGEVIKKQYDRNIIQDVFIKMDDVLHRRTIAYKTGVFNATPNGLCRGYCPVFECPHNGRSR